MEKELTPNEEVVEEAVITVEDSGLGNKSYMLIGGGIALAAAFAGVKLARFIRNKLAAKKQDEDVTDETDDDEEEVVDV